MTEGCGRRGRAGSHDWVGPHPAGLHLLRARRVQVALLLLARGHLATKKLQEVQHADEAAAEGAQAAEEDEEGKLVDVAVLGAEVADDEHRDEV